MKAKLLGKLTRGNDCIQSDLHELENRSSFWHPEMRKRVDNLVAELQGVG